ncbi:MAG: hypothetical protein ACI97A_004016 [Planctomycetota bacterium]|jgi:hypothetical protein
MTKKQIALLTVLLILCGYLNRELIFGAPEDLDDDSEYEDFEENDSGESTAVSHSDVTMESPIAGLSENSGRTRDGVNGHSRQESIPIQVEEESIILASLSKRIAEREEIAKLERQRDPFVPEDFNAKVIVEASEKISDDVVRKQVNDARAREVELAKALAEKTRSEERAARAKEIRSLPVHAIICSKRMSVARIRNRNLRVGDLVPGLSAKIIKIESKAVVVEFEGENIRIALTHGKRVRVKVKEDQGAGPQEANATPPPTLLKPDPGTSTPAATGGTQP